MFTVKIKYKSSSVFFCVLLSDTRFYDATRRVDSSWVGARVYIVPVLLLPLLL